MPSTALAAIAWAALGYLVGLALNRVAYALPAETSPRQAPRCAACGAPFPFVGGWSRSCRACGAAVPYDRLEWLVAGLFALLAVRFGPGGALVAYSTYTVALALASAIDLRHRYVYSVVSVPALLAALILSPLLLGVDLLMTLVGAGVALAIFAAFYVVGRIAYRSIEPVGKGDLELAAVIGAMVGFPRVLSALFLGSLANGIVIGLLLLARRRGRMDFIPYGPGLCFGAFVAFFTAP